MMNAMGEDATRGLEGRERRPYERPQLGSVKLAADEVLIGGCKSASGAGDLGHSIPCSGASACSVRGEKLGS